MPFGIIYSFVCALATQDVNSPSLAGPSTKRGTLSRKRPCENTGEWTHLVEVVFPLKFGTMSCHTQVHTQRYTQTHTHTHTHTHHVQKSSHQYLCTQSLLLIHTPIHTPLRSNHTPAPPPDGGTTPTPLPSSTSLLRRLVNTFTPSKRSRPTLPSEGGGTRKRELVTPLRVSAAASAQRRGAGGTTGGRKRWFQEEVCALVWHTV